VRFRNISQIRTNNKRAETAEIDLYWCAFVIFPKSAPISISQQFIQPRQVGALSTYSRNPHQQQERCSSQDRSLLVRFSQISQIRTNSKRAETAEIDLYWCAFAILQKSAPISTPQKFIQPRQIGALSPDSRNPHQPQAHRTSQDRSLLVRFRNITEIRTNFDSAKVYTAASNWCAFTRFQKSAPIASASNQPRSISVGALYTYSRDPHQQQAHRTSQNRFLLVRFHQIQEVRTNINYQSIILQTSHPISDT
jgi:hypothetical protein